MTDDKRRQPRYETRSRLWCEGQEHVHFGEARNISEGGMFIVADKDTKVGQHVRVSFEEENEQVSLELEVMWKGAEEADGGQGMGVRIVGFDSGKDVYSRFLNKLQYEGEKPAEEARPTAPPSLAPAAEG